MSRYELYMEIDKWYRKQELKILPKYIWEKIKQITL